MSGLLLDERLLCYQPALVRRIGLAEAAIVQQLHYWAQRSTHTHDGERYVYKTYGEWSDEIGISAKAVRGACDRLRRDGILVAIQSPLDSRDRTLWWRIDYAALDGDGSGAPSAPTGRPDATAGSSHARDRGGTESTSESTTAERARASKADEVPDDFPDALRPHARAVMRVLRSIAADRGSRKVTTRAVALTIAPRPNKPLVKAAHDCAAWIADHPEAPCLDVVARYRRWLDREPDLEAPERLTAEGVPASTPGQPPAGVTSLNARRGASKITSGGNLDRFNDSAW